MITTTNGVVLDAPTLPLPELEKLIESGRYTRGSPVRRALEELYRLKVRRDYTRLADDEGLVKYGSAVERLDVSRPQLTEAVVELGLGRYVMNNGKRRLLLNHWETDYVGSASFYPGAFTQKGIKALHLYFTKGQRPVLRGKPDV